MDRERFFPLQGILGVVNGNAFTGQSSQFGNKTKFAAYYIEYNHN
jgi:hypothetical protein